jgi:hypothetical protein
MVYASAIVLAFCSRASQVSEDHKGVALCARRIGIISSVNVKYVGRQLPTELSVRVYDRIDRLIPDPGSRSLRSLHLHLWIYGDRRGSRCYVSTVVYDLSAWA